MQCDKYYLRALALNYVNKVFQQHGFIIPSFIHHKLFLQKYFLTPPSLKSDFI